MQVLIAVPFYSELLIRIFMKICSSQRFPDINDITGSNCGMQFDILCGFVLKL